MDVNSILSLTCEKLRTELKKLNLNITGKKDELRNRLLQHHGLQIIDESEDETSFVDSMEQVHSSANQTSHFTPRDLEDSLQSFTGTNTLTVVEWLNEFEEVATTVGWNDLQRFIYGRQLLKGAAKQFIRCQSGLTDWTKLKNSLKDEFHHVTSAAEIHKALRNRHKRQNEALIEYLYSLLEIAKNTELDDESIVTYFADGIPDARQNKLVLYQASNVNELKQAIKVYEKVRGAYLSSNKSYAHTEMKTSNTTTKSSQKEGKNCFKCGQSSHLAKDCTKKEVKCFKCNNWGHRSYECKEAGTNKAKAERKDKTSTNCNIMAGKHEASSLIFKKIKIENCIVEALVDPGSVVSLVRYDVFMMIDDRTQIDGDRIQLAGIGDGQITTMGSAEATMCADGLTFKMRFHVIKEEDTVFSVVIGNDVLTKVGMWLTKGNATFKKQPDTEILGSKPEVTSNNEIQKLAVEEWLKENQKLCMMIDTKEFVSQEEPLDVKHLDVEVTNEVIQIIEQYKPKQQRESPVAMKILLTDDVPVYQRPRRIPEADKQAVEKQVAEWLEQQVIQPSTSEYASPTELVSKKDGSKRLCCDYRQLNQKTVKDNFPTMLMDEVVDKLQSAKMYTTLDLANGFFHVPVEAESRKYTSFVTHSGQYEFLYAPFGLKNSPAVFSRFIFAVFRELMQDGTVLIYVDDLIIPAEDVQESLNKLRKVLATAAEHNVKFRWKKCQFLRSKVQFLGYEIEGGTIRPSNIKIEAVEKFPVPSTYKEIQRFLGLIRIMRLLQNQYQICYGERLRLK